MPNPFVTVDDLINYLGRGTATDPGMLIATDAACDIVRTFAEQTFNADTSTLVLDGTGTDALILKERPVNVVGTVEVAGSEVTDYVLGPDGVLFRRGTVTDEDASLVWPAGRQNVSITYEHGYEDADLPRDVRMVALALAARIVVQGPAIQEAIGDVSVRYGTNSTDLTDTERAILRKYKRL